MRELKNGIGSSIDAAEKREGSSHYAEYTVKIRTEVRRTRDLYLTELLDLLGTQSSITSSDIIV